MNYFKKIKLSCVFGCGGFGAFAEMTFEIVPRIKRPFLHSWIGGQEEGREGTWKKSNNPSLESCEIVVCMGARRMINIMSIIMINMMRSWIYVRT